MPIELRIIRTDAEGSQLGGSAGSLKSLQQIVSDRLAGGREAEGFSPRTSRAIDAYWASSLAYEQAVAVKPAKPAAELTQLRNAVTAARFEILAVANEIKDKMRQFSIRFDDGGDINDKGFWDLSEQGFTQDFVLGAQGTITLGNRDLNKLRLFSIADDDFLAHQLVAEIKLRKLVQNANFTAEMASQAKPFKDFDDLSGMDRYNAIRRLVSENHLTEEDADYLSWVDGSQQNLLTTLLKTLPVKAGPGVEEGLVELRRRLQQACDVDLAIFSTASVPLVAVLKGILTGSNDAHRPLILQWMLDYTMGAIGSFGRRKEQLQSMLDTALHLRDNATRDEASIELAAAAEKELKRQGLELRAQQLTDLQVYQNYLRSVSAAVPDANIPHGAYRTLLEQGDIINYRTDVFATHGQFRIDYFIEMCKLLGFVGQTQDPIAEFHTRAEWEALFDRVNAHFKTVARELFDHVDHNMVNHGAPNLHAFPRYRDFKLMLELAEPSRGVQTVVQVPSLFGNPLHQPTADLLSRFGWNLSRSGHMPVTGGIPRQLTAWVRGENGAMHPHNHLCLDSMNGRSKVKGYDATGGYAAIVAYDTVHGKQVVVSTSVYNLNADAKLDLVHVVPGSLSLSSVAVADYRTLYAHGVTNQVALQQHIERTYGALAPLFSSENAQGKFAFTSLPASVLDVTLGMQLKGLVVKLLGERVPEANRSFQYGDNKTYTFNFASEDFSVQSYDATKNTVKLAKSYGPQQGFTSLLIELPVDAIDPASPSLSEQARALLTAPTAGAARGYAAASASAVTPFAAVSGVSGVGLARPTVPSRRVGSTAATENAS